MSALPPTGRPPEPCLAAREGPGLGHTRAAEYLFEVFSISSVLSD